MGSCFSSAPKCECPATPSRRQTECDDRNAAVRSLATQSREGDNEAGQNVRPSSDVPPGVRERVPGTVAFFGSSPSCTDGLPVLDSAALSAILGASPAPVAVLGVLGVETTPILDSMATIPSNLPSGAQAEDDCRSPLRTCACNVLEAARTGLGLEGAGPSEPQLVFQTEQGFTAVNCLLANDAALQALGLADKQDFLHFLARSFTRDPALRTIFHDLIMRLLSGRLDSVKHFVPGDFGNERYFLSMRMSPIAYRQDPRAAGRQPVPATQAAEGHAGDEECDNGGGRAMHSGGRPVMVPAMVLELDVPYEGKELAARLQRDYMVLSSIPSVVTIFNKDGFVLRQNAASVAFMGYLEGTQPADRQLLTQPSSLLDPVLSRSPSQACRTAAAATGTSGGFPTLEDVLGQRLHSGMAAPRVPRSVSGGWVPGVSTSTVREMSRRTGGSSARGLASSRSTPSGVATGSGGGPPGLGRASPLAWLFSADPKRLEQAMAAVRDGREWRGVVRMVQGPYGGGGECDDYPESRLLEASPLGTSALFATTSLPCQESGRGTSGAREAPFDSGDLAGSSGAFIAGRAHDSQAGRPSRGHGSRLRASDGAEVPAAGAGAAAGGVAPQPADGSHWDGAAMGSGSGAGLGRTGEVDRELPVRHRRGEPRGPAMRAPGPSALAGGGAAGKGSRVGAARNEGQTTQRGAVSAAVQTAAPAFQPLTVARQQKEANRGTAAQLASRSGGRRVISLRQAKLLRELRASVSAYQRGSLYNTGVLTGVAGTSSGLLPTGAAARHRGPPMHGSASQVNEMTGADPGVMQTVPCMERSALPVIAFGSPMRTAGPQTSPQPGAVRGNGGGLMRGSTELWQEAAHEAAAPEPAIGRSGCARSSVAIGAEPEALLSPPQAPQARVTDPEPPSFGFGRAPSHAGPPSFGQLLFQQPAPPQPSPPNLLAGRHHSAATVGAGGSAAAAVQDSAAAAMAAASLGKPPPAGAVSMALYTGATESNSSRGLRRGISVSEGQLQLDASSGNVMAHWAASLLATAETGGSQSHPHDTSTTTALSLELLRSNPQQQQQQQPPEHQGQQQQESHSQGTQLEPRSTRRLLAPPSSIGYCAFPPQTARLPSPLVRSLSSSNAQATSGAKVSSGTASTSAPAGGAGASADSGDVAAAEGPAAPGCAAGAGDVAAGRRSALSFAGAAAAAAPCPVTPSETSDLEAAVIAPSGSGENAGAAGSHSSADVHRIAAGGHEPLSGSGQLPRRSARVLAAPQSFAAQERERLQSGAGSGCDEPGTGLGGGARRVSQTSSAKDAASSSGGQEYSLALPEPFREDGKLVLALKPGPPAPLPVWMSPAPLPTASDPHLRACAASRTGSGVLQEEAPEDGGVVPAAWTAPSLSQIDLSHLQLQPLPPAQGPAGGTDVPQARVPGPGLQGTGPAQAGSRLVPASQDPATTPPDQAARSREQQHRQQLLPMPPAAWPKAAASVAGRRSNGGAEAAARVQANNAIRVVSTEARKQRRGELSALSRLSKLLRALRSGDGPRSQASNRTSVDSDVFGWDHPQPHAAHPPAAARASGGGGEASRAFRRAHHPALWQGDGVGGIQAADSMLMVSGPLLAVQVLPTGSRAQAAVGPFAGSVTPRAAGRTVRQHHPTASQAQPLADAGPSACGGGTATKAFAMAHGPVGQSRLSTTRDAGRGDGGGSSAGAERWHEVIVRPCSDPMSSEPVILVIQTDVTSKVKAEAALVEVLEAEHRLLADIFPRHVVSQMTQRSWHEALMERQAGGPGDGDGWGLELAGPLLAGLRVAHDPASLATAHDCVTLLFADIKGFTEMSKQVAPSVVMTFLNQLYTQYDSLTDVYGVYKVETIGDCYMVAGGLVARDVDGYGRAVRGEGDTDPLHATRVVAFARAMLEEAAKVMLPNTGEPVQVRIGIHSGPATSGVVGRKMPRFCLFGDTVNTASRMESTGRPGCLHVSDATFQLLPADEREEGGWGATGGVEVKGKGRMDTYLWRPQPASECRRRRHRAQRATLLGTIRDADVGYGTSSSGISQPDGASAASSRVLRHTASSGLDAIVSGGNVGGGGGRARVGSEPVSRLMVATFPSIAV